MTTSATVIPVTPIPPLESGDRLARAEFERRYQVMPWVKKAELIEGVVYTLIQPNAFSATIKPSSSAYR
jgi:hypothetical protein